MAKHKLDGRPSPSHQKAVTAVSTHGLGNQGLSFICGTTKDISRQPFGLVYVLKGHCDYSWRINFGVSTMEH